MINKYLVGGYVLPTEVYNAIGNGTASYAVLDFIGKAMNKIIPKPVAKAMTYISPLNYLAALKRGSINPKVGEEEISTWHPNIQLIGRMGEIAAGPKVIKGVKATPKVAVYTAAKAGVKPAKAAVIAREIKQATKNKPKHTSVPSKNLFRTLVYKGGEITDPHSNFVTTDPLYAANYGKVIPYIFESKSVAKAREPMMGYRDPVSLDMFIYNNTKGNPNVTAIIGHDAITGEFTPSKGVEILNMDSKNLYPVKTLEPPTSLAFFERKPKNNIVGTSLDYSMKDTKDINYLKLFFAQLKIMGKEYTLEGLKDAANVQQGLPEHIQSYLSLNTVERAVRAMRKNGYSEREILLYVDKVNEVMNKVKVGIYSDLEYNAAGALDFGGFYNNNTNFISINKDAYLTKPAFTPSHIMKHEGRHLIDYNTSMTDNVINTLEKAYDKDFLEIPKHKDAGSLKDYLHMDRERVTTNRDAREVFLSNSEKHPGEFLNKNKFSQTSFGKNKDMVDFLNELILYAEPEDIINAVENSNGYGKRYINYLRNNNKLTLTKIELLRLAMIHVPSYLLPVVGGYTLYNLFNQPLQQLQYLSK